MSGRTKKIQIPLNQIKGLTGTWTVSLDSSTNQLKLTKTKAAGAAKVAAEITPPVPSKGEPHVGYKLKSVGFSGVIADANASSMGISIYKNVFGDANASALSISIDSILAKATGTAMSIPLIGEYVSKANVQNPSIEKGDSKFVAVLSLSAPNTSGIDIRGAVAEFDEVDYSRA